MSNSFPSLSRECRIRTSGGFSCLNSVGNQQRKRFGPHHRWSVPLRKKCKVGESTNARQGAVGKCTPAHALLQTLCKPTEENSSDPILTPSNSGSLRPSANPYGTTLLRSSATSRKQRFSTAERNGVLVVVGSIHNVPTK